MTPRFVDDVGGLQLQVDIEGYIPPVTSDTSFDSPTSSRSPPKRRQRPPVDYKEESSSAVNSTSDHEVEESSGSSSETEYRCIEQAPATLDTALLQVSSFVVLFFDRFIVIIREYQTF